MANPSILVCNEDQIVLVASGVKNGTIHILDESAFYSHTYRDAGQAVPTDKTEFREFSNILLISSTIDIDVYILARGGSGRVRVDI